MNQELTQQIKNWKVVILDNLQDTPTNELSDWNDEFTNLVRLEETGDGNVNNLILDFDLECNHAKHADFELLSTKPTGSPDDLEPRESETLVCNVCGSQYNEEDRSWL